MWSWRCDKSSVSNTAQEAAGHTQQLQLLNYFQAQCPLYGGWYINKSGMVLATLPSTNHKCDTQKYPFPHCTLSKHPSKKTPEHYSLFFSTQNTGDVTNPIIFQFELGLSIWPTWLSCRLTWSLENVLPATTWAWLCLVSFYFSYSWTAPSHSQKASGSGKRLKNFMEEPKMINQQHFRGSTPILVLTMTTAWWGISPHSQL